jgi:hypothetical protein
MSNEARLAELRAKTDLELSRYLASELSLAVRLASEPGGQSRVRAQEAYTEIARLLPLIQDLDSTEHARLQSKLQRLRDMLDQLPTLAGAAC